MLKTIFIEIQKTNKIPEIKKPTVDEILELIDILNSNGLHLPSIIIKTLNIIMKKMNRVELLKIKNRLVERLDAKNRGARKVSIKLLRHLFSEDFIEDLIPKLTEKLFDKDISVRREVIKVLKDYQEITVKENTTVLTIFKDLLKYDQNPSVRKEVLKSILVQKNTMNSIISRGRDVNLGVRKEFYNNILQIINLNELSKKLKIELLKNCFTEREVNAREILYKKIREYYKMPEDLKKLLDEFYDDSVEKFLRNLLSQIYLDIPQNLDIFKICVPLKPTDQNKICERVSLSQSTLSYDHEDINSTSIFLILTYLEHLEHISGRDSLNLMPLDDYCMLLYQKIKTDIANKNLNQESSIYKNMFKILNFYDIFTEDVKKIIISVIYKILISNVEESEIIENCILLLKRTFKNFMDDSESEMINFLSCIIAKIIKTRGYNNKTLLLICKFIMKHINKLTDMHKAIVREIVNSFKEPLELEILFFYILIVKNVDFNEYEDSIRKILENFHFHKKIDILIDIWLTFDDERDRIEKYLIPYIHEINIKEEYIIIPILKILLVKDFQGFLKYIFYAFYNTEDQNIKQYLAVFFEEYLKMNQKMVLDEFLEILKFLKRDEKNAKIFINQVISWITDNEKLTEIFYKITLFLVNEWNGSIFEVIFNNELNYSPSLIKKMVYCYSKILKNVNDKRIQEFLIRIMGNDDGEPLSLDALESVKNDIKDVGSL